MTLWGEGSPDEEEIKRFFSLIVKDELEPVRSMLDKNKYGPITLKVRDFTGMTPLVAAANYGAVETSRFLIERGADVDAKSTRDYTPLMAAAIGGHSKIVALLLEKHADPYLINVRGETALYLAASKGDASCVDLLLKAGVDPMIRNRHDQSAFDIARDRDKKEALAVLNAWQDARNQKAIHARHIEQLDKMMKTRRKPGLHGG